MYDQIDLGKIQKSGFDLSYNNKGTGRIGRIIPTRCQPVLPGDRFKGSSTAAVQFEPLAVPMLANMYVRQEHFYVPNRIVWKNWDKFFTGGEKLDFTTPPPSFKSIYDVLTALGLVDKGFIEFPLKNTDTMAYGWYVDTVTNSASDVRLDFNVLMPHLADIRDFWTDKGQSTDTLDLLQPCIAAVDEFENNLRNHLHSWSDSNGRAFFMSKLQEPYINYLNIDQSEYGFSTQLGYLLSMSPDPYERAVAKAIDGYSVAAGVNQVFPLTEFGRSYVHMWYDMLKCFIGTSSNLDYLNYERCTLADLYHSFYIGFIDNVGTVQFAYETFSDRVLNGLALRANYAIWYNYYRDQLLEQNQPEPSTEDTITSDELFYLIVPRQRCWSKDTFTTALANTGTGNVVVPVVNGTAQGRRIDLSRYDVNGAAAADASFDDLDIYEITTSRGDTIKIPTRYISGLQETATQKMQNQSYFSLDVLDACRRAQKWLQKALIYGNRPQDRLYTSWGVRSLDARLQLPECLATSAQMVQLSVNTNNTSIVDANGAQMSLAGDKSANAYGYDKGGDFNRFCEEHGFIMSYLTILPEATYALHKSRCHSFMDKFDYPTPEFATLGMDAVYMSELMVCPSKLKVNSGTYKTVDDQVFGYQGRYYDHKSKQDEEHGTLQTTDDMYTFARTWNMFDLTSYPQLSYEFVHCFPRLDMFVVDSPLEDYFRFDIHHAMAAERALPVCGMYI